MQCNPLCSLKADWGANVVCGVPRGSWISWNDLFYTLWNQRGLCRPRRPPSFLILALWPFGDLGQDMWCSVSQYGNRHFNTYLDPITGDWVGQLESWAGTKFEGCRWPHRECFQWQSPSSTPSPLASSLPHDWIDSSVFSECHLKQRMSENMSSCSKSPSVIDQRLGQPVANGEENALLRA